MALPCHSVRTGLLTSGGIRLENTQMHLRRADMVEFSTLSGPSNNEEDSGRAARNAQLDREMEAIPSPRCGDGPGEYERVLIRNILRARDRHKAGEVKNPSVE